MAAAAALAILAAGPARAGRDHGRPGHAGGADHGGDAFRGHAGRHIAGLGRHGQARHAGEDRRDVRDWHRHGRREYAAADRLWQGGRGRSELVRRVSFTSRSEQIDGSDWRIWGWHAGPWPWAAWAWPSLAIGVSFGVIVAPPVIVPPPLFYAAPPPIVAALPAIAPPPIASPPLASPPVAVPPSAVRAPAPARGAVPPHGVPLTPPAAEALLGAAMPPPIVVLPPPLVIAAAGPPPLIFARPELALVITPPVLAFVRITPVFGWHGRVAGFREAAFVGSGRRRAGFAEMRPRFRDRHGWGHSTRDGLRRGAWTRSAIGGRHPASHGRDFGGWREARWEAGPGGRH